MAKASYAICVDVGGTYIKVGVAHKSGILVWKDKVPTPHSGPNDLVSAIGTQISLIRQLLSQNQISSVEKSKPLVEADICKVVGVAIPGIVNEKAGIAVLSANLGWENYPMKAELEKVIQQPVVLCHDVRSGALAESIWGVQEDSCFFVALGTGVAAGLVLDTELFSGNGYVGEIGQYLVANPDVSNEDISHLDTNLVPLETVCSAKAIATRYSSLNNLSDDDYVETKEVFARYEQGEESAVHVINTAVDYLAKVLAFTIATFGPIPIVIGGGLSEKGDSYLQSLKTATQKYLHIIPISDFHLATLGSWAQCLGAGAQALDAEKNDMR